MNIVLTKEDINSLYLEPLIKGDVKDIGIDYENNSLTGHYKNKEVTLFNFNYLCWLDNRWNTYTITINNRSEYSFITINIEGDNLHFFSS
jgi:hypothetical protein